MDPYLRAKFDPDGKLKQKWETLDSMNSARANFAHCVVNNFVYVFGGIGSRGEGKESHVPNIVNNVTEKYDINSNKWEIIEI